MSPKHRSHCTLQPIRPVFLVDFGFCGRFLGRTFNLTRRRSQKEDPGPSLTRRCLKGEASQPMKSVEAAPDFRFPIRPVKLGRTYRTYRNQRTGMGEAREALPTIHPPAFSRAKGAIEIAAMNRERGMGHPSNWARGRGPWGLPRFSGFLEVHEVRFERTQLPPQCAPGRGLLTAQLSTACWMMEIIKAAVMATPGSTSFDLPSPPSESYGSLRKSPSHPKRGKKRKPMKERGAFPPRNQGN